MRRITRHTIALGLAIYGIVVLLLAGIIVSYQPRDSLRFSDWMSLSQVILNILLLPTLILFIFELWNNVSFVDAKFKIRCWIANEEEKSIFFKESPPMNDCLIIEPALLNHGNIATVWYTLRIFVPIELYIERRPRGFSAIGNDDNWKITPHEGDMVYTFFSNGRYALLPGDDLRLAQWMIVLGKPARYTASYKIRYHLLVDKGKGINGTYTMEMNYSK
jgi:hypothetical protein